MRDLVLAAVVHGHSLRVSERPLPRLRPGWALLRVRLAGICSTDLEILCGYHGFRGVPGHEFVGEVVRAMPARGASRRTAERWVGRRVVGEINITCQGMGMTGVCGTCRRGFPTHCERRRVLGIVGQDGAFAEYLTLPMDNLHRVPRDVPDEAAVFTEPIAAACQILEQVNPGKIREAAVLGDGKLAQLVARVLANARLRVVMFGRNPVKLALAHEAGISTVLTGTQRRRSASKARFPLVVEATGSPDGLEQAIAMTAPRGTLVLKSTFHGEASFETWPLVVNEITVVGSRCGPFVRALELLRTRKIDPKPLISRVFPLRDAPYAIREAQAKGMLKVLLKP